MQSHLVQATRRNDFLSNTFSPDKMTNMYFLRAAPNALVVDFAGVTDNKYDPVQSSSYKRGRASNAEVALEYIYVAGSILDFGDETAPYCFGLLSDTFVQLLEDGNVSGFRTEMATVRHHDKVFERRALIVLGCCQPNLNDPNLSVVTIQEPTLAEVPDVPPGMSQIEVDELFMKWRNAAVFEQVTYQRGFSFNSWDGSDVFAAPGLTNWLFVTEEVKSLVENGGISGCVFQPVDDYLLPITPK